MVRVMRHVERMEDLLGHRNFMYWCAQQQSFEPLTCACRYLDFAAVLPERQGKGVGSHLLSRTLTALRRTDAFRESPFPFVLNTSLARNVRFYKKLGFEVVAEEVLARVPVPGRQPGDWMEVKFWWFKQTLEALPALSEQRNA